jgi:WD40 repeat protein
MIRACGLAACLLAGAPALLIAQAPVTNPEAIFMSAPASVGSMALATGPKRAVAGCSDGMLRLWDSSDGRLVLTLPLTNANIDFTAISPDGHWIFAGDHAGSAMVWDGGTGRVQLQVQLPHYPSTATFSRDSKLLAIAAMGDATQIFDVASARKLYEISTAVGTVAIAFSRDGMFFAEADADTAVRVYETRTGKLIAENHDFVMEPMAIDFTLDGKQVITAGADQVVTFLDAANGKVIRSSKRTKEPIVYLEVSPDGGSLALVFMKAENMTQPAPVAIWGVASGKQRSEWTPPNVAYAAGWTPDGHLMVAGDAENRMGIWQVR